MAFTRISLPFSLLIILSLLAIAFAADYSNDSSKYGNDGIPADSPLAKYEGSKPNGEDQKPINYDENPEGEEKPKYGTLKPEVYKPKQEETEKPYVVKPKPEGEEKPAYQTPNSYKPTKPVEKDDNEEEIPSANYYDNKPKAEEMQNYGSVKPEIYKPKPEAEKEKPEYVKKPNYETKQYTYSPKPEEENVKPYTIAVEGFVYCKTGSSHYPITGALAKVECEAVDEVLGVVKTVLCNAATDAKGYFYATVDESSNLKLKDCKAFLKNSPEKNCNVPTDVNKGITGFPLSGDYRVLHDKHTNLYSARPFFFTSDKPQPAAVPNGY